MVEELLNSRSYPVTGKGRKKYHSIAKESTILIGKSQFHDFLQARARGHTYCTHER